MGYTGGHLVEVQLKGRYVIVYENQDNWYDKTEVMYASTLEEAQDIIEELCKDNNQSDDVWCNGFIIDLAKMIPECVYDEKASELSEKCYTTF